MSHCLLNTSHSFSHLILKTRLSLRHYYYFHFIIWELDPDRLSSLPKATKVAGFKLKLAWLQSPSSSHCPTPILHSVDHRDRGVTCSGQGGRLEPRSPESWPGRSAEPQRPWGSLVERLKGEDCLSVSGALMSLPEHTGLSGPLGLIAVEKRTSHSGAWSPGPFSPSPNPLLSFLDDISSPFSSLRS